jgi:hypothetical protein
MYFLIWPLLAHADPVADLAPGPAELGTAQNELEQRLVVAEAIEHAVARLQSTWAVTPATDELCRDVIRGPMVSKLRRFAEAWHDAAQRVRTQAARVQRTAVAPTVTPVIDTDRRLRIDDMLERARQQESAWLEFVAWMQQEELGVCAITLETSPGLPDPLVRGAGEKRGAVAVLSLERGFVCPGATAVAPGQVVVVEDAVCWSSDQACGCTPAAQDPAAVLGR